MKILITGQKGFIGSSFFSRLTEKGYDVDGFDIGDTFPDERYDMMFHFAARGLIRKSVGIPYSYFQDDLDLAMRFLDKARIDGSCFVFPSSGSTAQPTNPYSLSKKQAVEWIALYRKLYGIKAYDLKFFNIYGPGSRKGGVYLFTKMALAGGPIEILGDGKDIRDFVYIDDLVNFLMDVAESRIPPGSYEVGTGQGTTIYSLAEKVASSVGGEVEITKKPDVIETARRLVATTPALRDPMSIDEGIKKVIEFIRNDR